MKQSKFLTLGVRDFLRGLAMAALTPAVTLITNSIEKGEFTLNWHLIILSAIGGAGAYFLKNLLTKPDSKETIPVVYADAPPVQEPIGGSNPPPKTGDK